MLFHIAKLFAMKEEEFLHVLALKPDLLTNKCSKQRRGEVKVPVYVSELMDESINSTLQAMKLRLPSVELHESKSLQESCCSSSHACLGSAKLALTAQAETVRRSR